MTTNSRNTAAPVIFISYSWDSNDHKSWVAALVDYLRRAGAGVIFDGDLKLGQRLPRFMEESIAKSDYVIVICTENYKAKADARIGGVGYENNIISGDLYSTSGLSEEKYIPILRSGSWATSLPGYMAGKLGIDCTNGIIDDQSMSDLLATFGLNAPKPEAAKVADISLRADDNGMNKHLHDDSAANDNTDIRITGIILDEVTQPKMDGTRGSALYTIPFRLSETPSSEWNQLFLQAWSLPPRFSTMHRPGIASIVGDTVVLDGTTIEEVAEYHRDTLVLCVEQANRQYRELCKRRDATDKMRREQEGQQRSHVAEVARNISF